MATVKKLLESYERTGSYRQTAREMDVSHNTVRKYVLRAQVAREGTIEEIVPVTGRSTNLVMLSPRKFETESTASLKMIARNRRNSDAMPNSSGTIFSHPVTH